MPGVLGGQKKTLDPMGWGVIDSYEPLHRCWKLKMDLL